MSTTNWLAVGLAGQLLFGSRFFVQWIASERARRSVIPVVFWWLSLLGSCLLLLYALHRRDPVFVLGQGSGLLIYVRNLHLIHRSRAEREGHLSGPPLAQT
jgi:lipid-A-disaccharide synthase-like uncharacterized protein